MKRKLVVLAMVLALVCVGGCETLGIIKSKVCAFSVQESAEAQSIINFIGAAAPLVTLATGIPVNAAQTVATLNSVATAAQTGACVLLTDLQNALAFFDTLSAEYNKVVVKTKAPKAIATPTVVSLRVRGK